MIELKNINFVYGSESAELIASMDKSAAAQDPAADAATTLDAGLQDEQAAPKALRGDSSDADGRLHDVNLSIEDGQFVLITGPSGCGKSTVLRLINGLIPHYYPGTLNGEVKIDGVDIASQELYETGLKVGTVFQNPRSQFFNVDTDSELAFACENRGMDPGVILDRMSATVERFDIESLMGRSIFRLSGGEKQKIACASIDVGDPRIVLLDEPSANLDFDATMRLRELIRLWKEQGRTIVAAEHRISYLWDLIDRAVIMSSGRIVADLDTPESRQLSDAQLAELGLRTTTPESPSEVELPAVGSDDATLTLNDFRFSYRTGLFAREKERRSKTAEPTIDFSGTRIAMGKVTAIVGPNGSGKTTLLNCLCGLERRCKGTIDLNGEACDRRALRGKVFMVMQDVNHQLFTESALEEVRISMEANGEEADDDVLHHILAQVDLDAFADRHPMSLSGGQKQRLAVACALASGSDILLFDEPTSGLDYRHMQQTADLMKGLKEMGKTLVVVTHDSEFIRSCCDCTLAIKNGRPA